MGGMDQGVEEKKKVKLFLSTHPRWLTLLPQYLNYGKPCVKTARVMPIAARQHN